MVEEGRELTKGSVVRRGSQERMCREGESITNRRGRWKVLWLRGVGEILASGMRFFLSSLKRFPSSSLIPGPLWTKQLGQRRVSHDPG